MSKEANQHILTVRITGLEPFDIAIDASELSFYNMAIDSINTHIDRFHLMRNDSTSVALGKVLLLNTTMARKRTFQVKSQAELLDKFENRLDTFLEGMEEPEAV